MRNYLSLIILAIFLTPSFVVASEDTTPTLDYIKSTKEDGVYDIYGKNLPSDPSRINLTANDKKIGNYNMTLSKEKIHLKNFYPNAGTFLIEFMKVEYESGGTAKYVTDKKSDPIKIRKNNTIGFNGQLIRDNKNGANVVTLPFLEKLPQDILLGQDSLKSERKLIINGQEQLLQEYSGEYKAGIYYYAPDGITFIEKNLMERLSIIGLKIDTLSSNYISIKKEWLVLDSPSRIEIEDTWTSRYLKIFFSEPRNFTSLSNKEISINGIKIDINKEATIGLGQFIIRYDITKLPKDQDTLSIILKDMINNEYSNEQIIHVGTYSLPRITSIDTGKWDSANFTFAIKGSPMAFFWDMYKLEINLNGTGYTRDGIKEPIKDGSGVIQKDSNGSDRFTIRNKIEMKRTGEGIEFDFYYNQLKEGENILFIKNGNTLRESNIVAFKKNSTASANYNYLTGTILTESTKKELLTFEMGKDADKKVNPASMVSGDRDISLGRLKLSNIKNDEFYSLSFTLKTDLTTNPFSQVMLDLNNLETVASKDWLSFVFKKQGFWKNFKTDMELISSINELYNVSDKPFSLTIDEIRLQKLNKENTYDTIISVKNPLKANLWYAFTNNICFDGVKDFCSITGEWDPVFSLNMKTSGTPIIPENPVQDTWASSEKMTTIMWKKNISTVVIQDFENVKFKKVQDILIKSYNNLKKKNSIYIPTFRKSINDLLFSLRNFELKINTKESINQVKKSLKAINEVLKKAKNE